MAWRNIWRNKRRTLITAASILFAVLFASLMESMQKGIWNNMIRNVVNYYFGYAQVHSKGYWGDQSIDKAFSLTDSIRRLQSEVPEISNLLPRIESFALASSGNTTTGAMVVGVDPVAENAMTNLSGRLVKGTYFSSGERAALIGEDLADHLNLKVGDTLLLISQGYHGVNSAGKYPVKGLAHFPTPELNRQMVYLPLGEAQWFYGAEGMITSLALRIEDQDDIQPAVRALRERLDGETYEVMDWKELIPDLLQAKRFDSAGNIIVYFILYLVIAFGIFGTILMMTKEREYEFGILLAIGMRRRQLAWTIWIETVFLGLVGALAGIALSIPVVGYFHVHPIRFTGNYAGTMEKFGFEPVFPAELDPRIFLTQALVVFLVTGVLAAFPWLKIRRLDPARAMRP